MLNSASGRVFAAFMPEHVVEGAIAAEFSDGIRPLHDEKELSRPQFRKLLDTVRAKGFALTRGSIDLGGELGRSYGRLAKQRRYQTTKAGGVNLPSGGGAYRPESIDAYELGFKSEWFGRALPLNAAIFYKDYKDLQVNITIPPATTQVNSTDAVIRGLKGEIQWKPGNDTRISISATYLDAEFRNFVGFDPVDNQFHDLHGFRFPTRRNLLRMPRSSRVSISRPMDAIGLRSVAISPIRPTSC